MNPQFEPLLKEFEGSYFLDEPLSRHTYYRIGGRAALLVQPRTLEDLKRIHEFTSREEIACFILGNGSNVLASDEGFAGVVVKTSLLNKEIVALGSDLIQTGASVAVSTLLRRAGQEGWGGLEFLSGVPGSIGGVVAMNAGTHLGESQKALHQVDYFYDGQVVEVRGEGLKFSYRKNHFLPPGAIVIQAKWRVVPDSPEGVKRVIRETLERRKATQPIDYPSCGSVFKNPKEMRSWQVLDRLGLRGYRMGSAQFSEKHPNFIVNHGGAKSSDVKALIELAKTRAHQELGIELEEEVKYL